MVPDQQAIKKPRPFPLWLRLLLTTGGIALTVLVRQALQNHLVIGAQFVIFMPILILAAIYGGLWPGIYAVLSIGLLVFYVFPFPESWTLPSSPFPDMRASIYCIFSAFLLIISESVRRARAKAERAAKEAAETAEDLSRKEFQLRTITDSLPVLVSYLDREFRFIFTNKTFESWFGPLGADLCGKKLSAVMPLDMFAEFSAKITPTLAGKPVTFDLPYAGVSHRHLRCSFIPRCDDQGDVKGFLSMVTDVTEQRLAESERSHLFELEKERSQQLQLIAQTAVAINQEMPQSNLILLLANAAKTVINSAYASVVLFDSPESCAPSCADEFAMPPHIVASAVATENTCWATVESLKTAAYDLVKITSTGQRLSPNHLSSSKAYQAFLQELKNGAKDGVPPHSWLVAPLIGIDGRSMGILQLCDKPSGDFTTDDEAIVTQLAQLASTAIETNHLVISERSARSQAERANRMKDEFLSTLSHELRTPMNSILGWAQILRSPGCSDKDLAKGLETIERSAINQSQLISDLLDMSRIISGRVRLDIEPISLEQIIDAALAVIKPSIELKKISITTDLQKTVGPVTGDSARLQQVFINILSNAVKFTPLAGKITIFLRQIQNRFEIKITDTGIGIKPEFKPYVFERFRQAELSTTKRFGGMGLGLAIAKQLVELHGGSISVESAGEGQGATFKVLLPPGPPSDIRADSPAIFPKQGHLQQKVPDLGGQRILVIDDEPDARTLISRILLETKAEVETAASAKEALTSLNTQLPDILISDIGLPGIDGYELMKLIRKRPVDAGGSIPAIALTAFARPEDKSRALRAGFQMHLTKPIDWASLMAAITLLVPQAKMLAAKKGPTDDSQF